MRDYMMIAIEATPTFVRILFNSLINDSTATRAGVAAPGPKLMDSTRVPCSFNGSTSLCPRRIPTDWMHQNSASKGNESRPKSLSQSGAGDHQHAGRTDDHIQQRTAYDLNSFCGHKARCWECRPLAWCHYYTLQFAGRIRNAFSHILPSQAHHCPATRRSVRDWSTD